MGEKSDASTTTEDMKMAPGPLCLFYFSHPFGILSPDPPSITRAPEGCLQTSWIPTFSESPWNSAPSFSARIPGERDQLQSFGEKNAGSNHHQINPCCLKNDRLKNTKPMCHYLDQKRRIHHIPKCRNKQTEDVRSNRNREGELCKGRYTRNVEQKLNKLEVKRRERKYVAELKEKQWNNMWLQKNEIDERKQEVYPFTNFKSGFNRQGHNMTNSLPPIDKSIQKLHKDRRKDPSDNWVDIDERNLIGNKKVYLPPIGVDGIAQSNMEERLTSGFQSNEKVMVNEQEKLMGGSRNVKNGKRFTKRRRGKVVRLVKSSRGVNKGRAGVNRSAARKLVMCLLQSVGKGRRATTASLPVLSEVLKTVRGAWASPKSLLSHSSRLCDSSVVVSGAASASAEGAQAAQGGGMAGAAGGRSVHGGAGASPGLMRRRYSVPETVMRKYKLAQQKSDSDDSEVGSAPSPRGQSPLRWSGSGGAGGSRGRERGPRSSLLRRLWGREGGSHADLSRGESSPRSGSSSPRSPDRTCEACRRLSDRNLSRQTSNAPLIFKTFTTHPSRSPKRQKLSPATITGQSPERYITQLESNRAELLAREREMRQNSSPTIRPAGSSTSERSFYKNASSEGSPKLGLSSLATSSYPATDGNATSELSSNHTRSSASYSSDDAQFKIKQDGPITTSNDVDMDDSINLPKKRRQSDGVYAKTLDSSSAEMRSGSASDNKAQKSEDSVDNSLISHDSQSENIDYSTHTQNSKYNTDSYTSPLDTMTTRTTEKTTTAESTSTKTLTSNNETTSPSDSAMSSEKTHSGEIRKTPESQDSNTRSSSEKENVNQDQRSKHVNNNNLSELSDTGISECLEWDANKNSFNSDEPDQNVSGSITYSEDCSTDINSDVITCIEILNNNNMQVTHIKPYDFECLEVIVSETINSAISELENSKKMEMKSIESQPDTTAIVPKENHAKSVCNKIDIDQYVSCILIESLNTMTDQINEINSNVEDDMKLNILEKEIKVKLQSANSSPLSLTSNPIITSLLTNIPDKELLETTVIEEKTTSLAYTTESKLFPIQNTTEIHEARSTIDTFDENAEAIGLNNNYNVDIDGMENLAKETVTGKAKLNKSFEHQEALNNNNIDSASPPEIDISSSDLNENKETMNSSHKYGTSDAVLQQLHRMFENNPQATLQPLCTEVDSNFNFCVDNQQKAYFCGTVIRDLSHLEMSTDVDVFVDNSLNKMMNSIEIDCQGSDLCKDIVKLSLNDKISPGSKTNTVNKYEEKSKSVTSKVDGGNVLGNVGSGSVYVKPPEQPLIVPRYSALPYSESMEVNTSSEEEESSCESDCLSLVDSLDDPSSPRLALDDREKTRKKASKHDKKLARGGIISLLPENTDAHVATPKEKSKKFFIPIVEDSTDIIVDKNIVVADHMPDKIKERLHMREQKRELRKEHYKRKKLRQMKRELEKQKMAEVKKRKEEHEKECSQILSQLVEEITERGNTDDKKKPYISQKISSQSLKRLETDKKKSPSKKVPHKMEKSSRKDESISEFESFVVDKQGNIQMKHPRRVTEGLKKKEKEALYEAELKKESFEVAKYMTSKTNESIQTKLSKVGSRREHKVSRIDPHLVGPRRLYQKTEFKEGNRHVEILEIVECVDSSPEPSDESQDSFCNIKRNKSSKIPVPVHEKLHSIKNRGMQKSYKSCKSPVNKSIPMNLTTARNEQKYCKTPNSKIDMLIANILIDAFNEDNPENRNIQVVSSPRERKSKTPPQKDSAPLQIPSRRASIPQQNHEKATAMTKYTQKFEVIPEERSSMSIESSNEDTNMATVPRRASLPAELKLNATQSGNSTETKGDRKSERKSPVKDNGKIPLKPIYEEMPYIQDAKTQKNTSTSPQKKRIEDASTSPIPQYISTATSPIPQTTSSDSKHDANRQMKGKNALRSGDGWAGFCRPQMGCSPDHEGSHPSSNNPSDREAIEKMEIVKRSEPEISDTTKDAPRSQRVLRTVDSRNNIKQINIHHEVNKNTKRSKEDRQNAENSDRSSNKGAVKKHHSKSRKIYLQDETTSTTNKHKTVGKHDSQYDPVLNNGHKNHSHNSESNHSDVSKRNHGDKRNKSESRDSAESKIVKLPSPFKSQSHSDGMSSSGSGSGSDSEVTPCPVLMPRLLPAATVLRQRRTFNRRHYRHDEQFRLPYENSTGGWSVTLAGSCYTALPTDVEMKVSFPKTSQCQVNSQSDSGLGDDHHCKRVSNLPNAVSCNKCGNRESSCNNCSISQKCKCISAVKQQTEERQSFLPPAHIGKMTSSRNDFAEFTEQTAKSTKKYYQYLPDVNSMQLPKNKNAKKSSLKMARRLSLHCWLPESKDGQRIPKLEVTERSVPDEESLSVLGCAILPGMKPRVPTMSERDLTRFQSAQFYSRNRII